MTRCEQCRKKLGIQEYKCKCEKIFCISHLHAEAHNCNYDYHTEAKEILKRQLDIGQLKEKMEKI